jgi:hypothetical protein
VIPALFILALVVAALGIPGALPWLQRRSILNNEAAALTLEVRAARRDLSAAVNARTLVPPSSPSAVRPPGPSPIPTLSAEEAASNWDRAIGNRPRVQVPTLTQLREHALDDIETALAPAPEQPSRRDGGSGGRGGKVGGGPPPAAPPVSGRRPG